jgi:hypothetical protein
LLEGAWKSMAYATRSARDCENLYDCENLSPENPAAKPFYISLQKINTALVKADAGFKENKPEFFQAIDSARSAVTEMQVTWKLTGSDDKNVIAEAKKLGGNIVALHENFSPLAARRSKGGKLSAAEKKMLDKIKADQKVLDKKLDAFASKYKSNRVLLAGIKQIRQKSLIIARAGDTVDDFVDALNLLSSIQGLFSGYSYYLPPSKRTAWVVVFPVPSKPAYWEYYSSYPYDWSYMESPVEIYDSENFEENPEESKSEVTYLDYYEEFWKATLPKTEEITREKSYLEENDFTMSDDEQADVAEESNAITEEDMAENDLESEQEKVANNEAQYDTDDQDGGRE